MNDLLNFALEAHGGFKPLEQSGECNGGRLHY